MVAHKAYVHATTVKPYDMVLVSQDTEV